MYSISKFLLILKGCTIAKKEGEENEGRNVRNEIKEETYRGRSALRQSLDAFLASLTTMLLRFSSSLLSPFVA